MSKRLEYTEFIQYIDEIIDYDKIVAEYGLSYSDIDFVIKDLESRVRGEFIPESPYRKAKEGGE